MQEPVGLSALVVEWCTRELGGTPVERLLSSTQMSEVAAVRLDDGRRIVVKVRPDEAGRAKACVDVQRFLADSRYPCPRPLTAVTVMDGQTVHAEEWLPGGDMLRGEVVRGLLGDLSWKREWITDLGGIKTARAAEAAILFVPHVIRAGGFAPFAISITR
ncbi:hypothetical protein ABZ835_46505 [Streptomyces sp. NPDC047461]|uniref:hypothetical protein n=1 Tax=Streptomyces sp. NPDC047461 TaxID=3155619 RepID=UPI00340F6675